MDPLFELIAGETRENGIISFARFMELALYCPVCGYYEKEKDNIGRHGDYFTSASVGPLFGELLAFQFAEWLRDPYARGARLEIVEAGAHNGQLAKDILTWLHEKRTDLFARLQYSIVEPSPTRRAWQKENLLRFHDRVRWAASPDDLRKSGINSGVHGIVFANELLDAMPTHRLGWDANTRNWFEWGVAVQEEHLVWKKIQNPKFEVQPPALPAELRNVLPDGFMTEVCPAATNWWRAVAGILREGRLLTLDYGLTAEEFFHPERKNGTVRSYRNHQAKSDVLADAGEQDITAHVNFTAVQQAGEAAGLGTESFLFQEQFLTQIADRISRDPAAFGEWTPARARQFQTLTHPEHLGRSFRVLVQRRPPARR